MKATIWTLWITRTYSPDQPELVEAWDEFSVDENEEGWAKACATAVASIGNDLQDKRELQVLVDYDEVQAAFAPPKVEGRVCQ